MLTKPYLSTKAAIAAASSISRPLDLPAATSETRVQSTPDGDGLDRPIAVRAVLVRCSIDPDGEDAALLYRWATTADTRDEHDDAAEAASSPGEYQHAIATGRAVRARLAALIDAVSGALVEARVVKRPPKLALHRCGWRVHEYPGGRREVVLVLDPDLGDETVYRLHAAALEVAAGRMGGPVVSATAITSTRKHPALAMDLGPAWERGEYSTLAELDAAVAERLMCTPRWARVVRKSWGIDGTRGREPTRPPNQMGSDAHSNDRLDRPLMDL